MDRLAEMEAFVQVVDDGGFTEAARKLGLSKSAVSKHVSALEARLAVRLLTRTTRRVSPTEVGLAYYDRARAVLQQAGDADSMVTAMQATPKGTLRVSAPVAFGVGAGGAGGRGLPLPPTPRSTSRWCSTTASSSSSPRATTSPSASARFADSSLQARGGSPRRAA